MVIRSEGAVEYVMVGVSRRPTQAIWRGKEIEPVQCRVSKLIATSFLLIFDRGSFLLSTILRSCPYLKTLVLTLLSIPCPPQNMYISTSRKRLCDARPSNIKPLMDRMKLLVFELDPPSVDIQARNVLPFQSWNMLRFHYINPFPAYSKTTVISVIFQRIFAHHNQHSGYLAVFTDGIGDKEQADSSAWSTMTHQPLAVSLLDMKRIILRHILTAWQESRSQQLDNKLHFLKPVAAACPVMPMRRADAKLTRLSIGHTCCKHKNLMVGENAPECPSCKVWNTV
ncbi:RNase H domain-containing protein [Trichonephila clavipes]|nr:RNase H domain-containing protein [Trichonephila clavipes]